MKYLENIFDPFEPTNRIGYAGRATIVEGGIIRDESCRKPDHRW